MSANINESKKTESGAAGTGSPVSRKKKRRKKPRYDARRLLILAVAACMVIGLIGYGGYMGISALGNLLFGPSQDPSVASAMPSKSSSAQSSSAKSSSNVSSDSSSESSSDENAAPDPLDTDRIALLSNMKANIEQATSPNELADLGEQIKAYLSEHHIDPSKISWAVQDLTTNAWIESDNARDNFTAASTYKLPLCMHYYEEIANGNINPNDTLEYSEKMREDEDKENLNQPIHRKFKVGDKIQIDELLEAALLYSDNIAGHMLYENLGGYENFKKIVSRYSPLEQTPEFYSERYNVLSADYMMRLLAIIYNTPGTFNDLKYWLQNASIDTYLNRSLSGHYIQKIGNINEVRNAGGISNGPAPFTLSIYSCIGKQEGQNVIDDLGVLVNNYFVNKYNSGFYGGQKADLIAMLNAQISLPYDVIYLRPGPQGQTLPDLTPEEESMANEALLSD